MKFLFHFVVFGLLVIVADAAEQLPVFNAVLSMGKESRFVLIGSDGKSSSWLKLEDRFEGFVLKRYDNRTSTLEVEKDGKSFLVTLVADAAVAEGEALAPATLSDAGDVLRKMQMTEFLRRRAESQSKTIAANMEQHVKRLVDAGVPAADVEASRRQMLAHFAEVMNPDQLEAALAGVYAKVFTKEELERMSAFYTTPAGEAIARKQGDVQEQMDLVLRQRWAAVQPKINELSREMVAKARKAAAEKKATPKP